ncbi:hypothetical protein [Paenibacillus sp. sgz5001063]|uniref:hypothetical protein n=1 Tax=Paenibacillus sp. sgz5001063 TaxID=3242474 RepID=UPI0036D33410
MITENDVIRAVCLKLDKHGFSIQQSLNTLEKGIDVIARRNDFILYLEAKGETSALITSKRYGKPFNQNQIVDHVAKALLSVSKILTTRTDDNFGIAIALPDNLGHRKVIREIEHAIKLLDITMFWVAADGSVDIVNSLENKKYYT